MDEGAMMISSFLLIIAGLFCISIAWCSAFFPEIGEVLSAYVLEEFAEMRHLLKPEIVRDLFHTGARLNRLPEAEARYRQALKLDPKSKAARLGLAGVLCQQGDGADAMSFADSVLRDFPKDADAHYQVATAANTTGNTAAAVQHYLAALHDQV